MPVELVKKIDLGLLYPPFLMQFLQLLANCRARGADYFATDGYRDPVVSDAKYQQGRSLPGPKISNAPGWLSTHNYGIGGDVAFDKDKKRFGLQPDWEHDEVYAILHEEAAKLGLQAGVPSVPGGDLGHVSLNFKMHGLKEIDVLRQLKPLYDTRLATHESLLPCWSLLDVLVHDWFAPSPASTT